MNGSEVRESGGEAPVAGTRGAEWWLVPLWATAFALLYLAMLQERFYGDGPGLVGFVLRGSGKEYYNVLFVPLCRWLSDFAGIDPMRVTHVISALSSAAGVAFAWPVLRAFGLRPARATLGCLLLGLTPVVLFFATTSEVHALHLGRVSLCACVTLYAPWRRPWLALSLTALVFPLLYWSHVTAVLLGPGWVLLVQYARTRKDRPFSIGVLLAVVGPILLGALVLAIGLANLERFGSFSLDTSDIAGQVGEYYNPPKANWMAWSGWLLPLLLLVPLAAIGVRRGPRTGWGDLALLGLIVPSLVFFLVWGVAERGAYFSGTVVFWAGFAARGLPDLRPGRGRAVATALLLVQALVATYLVREHDQGWSPAERAQRVRECMGESGTLINCGNWAVSITEVMPDVVDAPFWDIVPRYEAAGASREEFATAVADQMGALIQQGPVGLDESYLRRAQDPVVALRLPWIEALVEELERRFDFERCPHEDWPMARMTLRSE